MKARILKIVLPALLAAALCAAPGAFASGHGAVTADDNAALHGVEAAHDANKAFEEKQHGDTAAAAHDEKMAAEHSKAVVEGEHATGVEGEGHGGAAHHKPMITAEKLKDLFWRTVNFIALVIILVKFLAKPIGNGLSGRRRQIQEELEALQAKRDEAERSYKEFEARLAGMEKEMETVVEKAIAMAEDEKVRILKEAEKSAEDIKRQAEAAVNAAVVDAKRSLQDEVAEKAAAMAEELIVKNLTPEDQVAITEQYLEKVGAVQ
jgi:F-type H+-transporting ATPase subunit b